MNKETRAGAAKSVLRATKAALAKKELVDNQDKTVIPENLDLTVYQVAQEIEELMELPVYEEIKASKVTMARKVFGATKEARDNQDLAETVSKDQKEKRAIEVTTATRVQKDEKDVKVTTELEGTKDTKVILGHKDRKGTTAKKVNRVVMHSVTKAKKVLWGHPELPVKTVKMEPMDHGASRETMEPAAQKVSKVQ